MFAILPKFLPFLLLRYLLAVVADDAIVFGTTPIGYPCSSSSECVGEPDISSECRSNICLCRTGYLPSYDLENCLKIVDQIGGECEESTQCQQGTPGEYSDCILGPSGSSTCQCTSEAVNEPCNHICFKKAGAVGDPCEVNIQCTSSFGEMSKCSEENHICICAPGALPLPPDNKTCVPEKDGKNLIGDACQFSFQCIGSSRLQSECTISGKCACSKGFIPSAKMNECLPIVDHLGEGCSESQQCQHGIPGWNSVCVKSEVKPYLQNKICNCTKEAVNQPGGHVCFPEAKFVGAPCEIHEQCFAKLGPSHCYNGFCSCFQTAKASIDNMMCVNENVN